MPIKIPVNLHDIMLKQIKVSNCKGLEIVIFMFGLTRSFELFIA